MNLRRWLMGVIALAGASALRAQNVGYVVDNAGGQVQVINLATRTVTSSIPTGGGASEMFIQPDNGFAFVSDNTGGGVAVLDLATRTRVASIATGPSPGSLSATPDGRFLYVSDDTANEVAAIDTAARTVIARIPVGATPVQVNVAPDGRYAYVVNRDELPSGTVSVIDVNRNTVVKTLTVGLRPNQFAILPNLNTAYVVNTGSGSLSLVDMTRNEVTGSVQVGRGPVSVAFSSDSTRLYVVNRDSNSVSVVSTAQNRLLAEIPVGTQPAAMAVTFDSKYGYVSNSGSNTVTLLDLTMNTAELDIPAGNSPFSLMLDPDENYLYVTNLNSGSVSVIDVNTDKQIAAIPVGGVPVQFTMLNAPTLLEVAPNPALAGNRVVLGGEGFLRSSVVRFVTANPPRTTVVQPVFLDSQGLEATVPVFQGTSAVVSVANPDANSSEQVTLRTGTATPSIFQGGVVEGAGFAKAPAPISGNAIVSVFGHFAGMAGAEAKVFPLPETLGNAMVTFNGVPAPLLATALVAGYDQINLVAPVRLFAREAVRVAVTVSGQTSIAETVNVAPVSPGAFAISAESAGAFLHANNTLVDASNPALRGEVIQMYTGGMGDTAPEPLDRQKAPGDVLAWTVLLPAVTVGGAQAGVSFHGLAPCCSGLYQINFEVPQAAPQGSDVPVSFTIGGRTSNTVRLAVQ